ncbi:hypothetical protein [Haloglomus litoreum]|uniref:hypothetical protein n=1 Tax=Haloglomus litoreum TaxID=3034026 RepID=UPI0023E8C0F3|nr:hypothetical protein [Haloglomus sp. DT116]
MTRDALHRFATRAGKTLLGGIVVLLTLPTGIGAAFGGWLAGHGCERPLDGSIAGATAGLVGALPWAGLVYLASAGAFAPIGYHRNGVHVGINTAAPELLAPWQEFGLTLLFAACLVGIAAAGGALAGTGIAVVDTLREEVSSAN